MAADFAYAWLWPAIAAPFIGSFVGLVVLRVPAGLPVSAGRSACPHCGTRLGVTELAPLLSWILLRGRCRHCHTALSLFYPGIELAALAAALWAMLILPEPLVWAGCALGWALLAASIIDFKHLILPDAIVLPLIPAGVAVHYLVAPDRWPDHAIGAAAGYLAMAAIRASYARIRGREGLGLGDAKLFAVAGAWVGWQGLPSVLFVGALATLVVLLVLQAARPSMDLNREIPFGPALAFAIWLVWLYGPLALA